MSKKIIEVSNLGFSYGIENILEKISFDVNENDFVGIIGPNGGGKTTLVKILLGLLPVSSGTVRIFGEKPLKNPHKIAYLPQQLIFDPAIPITVKEVVLMGCLGHGLMSFYNKCDRKNADHAMEIMNVKELKNKFFSSLSGGQKQRVLIARALTCNPKLLILDEPSASIDNYHEEILHELLKDLNKKMAVIMVSHEYHLVSSLVDYVMCIDGQFHIHKPNEITADNFEELISKKFYYVHHDHKVKKS